MTITISCTHPQVDYQLDLETSHNIAISHNQGLGCPQDHRLAAYWFESAASRGHAPSQLELGLLYFHGRGVSQSYLLAEECFRSSAAQGIPRAQYMLGHMYAKGLSVPRNVEEALKWLSLAADQGQSEAITMMQELSQEIDMETQYEIGLKYYNGDGVAQDYSDAFRWFRLSADQGCEPAQYALGIMYENGHGVPQDDPEAVKWYRLAADQGYPPAQNSLGIMYEEGLGVTQDYNEAIKWYRLAADQGYPVAQCNLGWKYAGGQGVQQDYSEAVKWFQLAAYQGDARAQWSLGYMYQFGYGITHNDPEAVKWYRLAADQGNADAQYCLGLMYTNGHGVPQDCAEAGKWYRLAAEQGDEEAKKRLLELETVSTQGDHPIDKLPPSPKPIHLDAKSTDTRLNELLTELNKLIGLERVKQEIYKLIQFVQFQQLRKTRGLKTEPISMHSVFYGNPGTGKTTVARIYGQMLNTLGLLSKGHLVETDRTGLIAGYVGQTELKTDEKIKEALGGILFIDEAYSLFKGDGSGWDYGQEAISVLIKRMEDHRDDFVVIVAGYDQPMEEFLKSNEGLKSRFATYVHFDDYSSDDLVNIFKLFCAEGQYEPTKPAINLVRQYFDDARENRDETFGNGRLARNLYQYVVRNMSVRIGQTLHSDNVTDLSAILPEDIQPLLQCPAKDDKSKQTKLRSVK